MYLPEGLGLFTTKHTTMITTIRRRNAATMTVHHIVLKNPAEKKKIEQEQMYVNPQILYFVCTEIKITTKLTKVDVGRRLKQC